MSELAAEIQKKATPQQEANLVWELSGDSAQLIVRKILFERDQLRRQVEQQAESAEIERLRDLIRNVIEGNWSVTGLQEAIGEI